MVANLFQDDAEAYVNPVNTAGVMGKGLALQFKKAFPEMVKSYEEACRTGELHPGKMHVYDRGVNAKPRFIINFPTKRHWRDKSRLEDIQGGLAALVEEVRRRRISSIALPPLGCGLGGLSWSEVFPLIQKAVEQLPDVEIAVYAPREIESV